MRTLITRKKWLKLEQNFEGGELVLLQAHNLLKNQWPLVQINKIMKNRDRRVHCFEVRRPDGTIFTCDLSNICKLECSAYDAL